MKQHMQDFDSNIKDFSSAKEAQISACQRMMTVMSSMIMIKDGGMSKTNFKGRGLGENSAGIDELLKYLYEKFTDLFRVGPKTEESVNLTLKSVLQVLDDIPDELLRK